MLIKSDKMWEEFEFWAGAFYTVETLTEYQMSDIWSILENDVFPEGATETEINDFFWFERDTIAEWLGFDSWEELEEANETER